MRRLVALGLVAACGGGPGVVGEREKLSLRLIECVPAQPLFVEVDGRVTTHGRLDSDGMGWAASKSGTTKRMVTMSQSMATTQGLMDGLVIKRAVAAKQADITHCYEREIQANPSSTRHQVAWRFSIAQSGHVIFADPTTQVLSASTSSCISRAFRSMTFPARATGGSVTVTLTLTLDSIPVGERAPAAANTTKVAWTPFAVGAFAPERAS